MNRLILLAIGICLLLIACVQSPVIKGGGYAFIKSNYPFVSMNGAEIEPSYKLDIPAGENTLVIIYHTYRYDYYCTFTWTAVADTAYEVTDQDNKYPLTLYRWVRQNRLLSLRLDPIDPLTCSQEPRR
jgi:hypothetical protein